MSDLYAQTGESAGALGTALPEDELASLTERLDMGERELEAVADVFAYLAERRRQNKAGTCPETGRLPPEAPKTFANFDFDRPRGADRAATGRPPAMADPRARRSLASVGPEGVGKTHLARAYARGCCERGMQSYHVKARELRDKLASSVRSGGGGCAAGTLARANCLAVDEIGRRASGKERAGPPLRVVERRCEHEGPTLPRVLDGATLFVARGARPPQCGLEDLCGGDGARGGQDPPSWASRRLGREDKDSEIDDSGVLAILI